MIRKEEAFDEDRFWGGQVSAQESPLSSKKPAKSRKKAS
jgi:hypothetical protein